MFVRCRDVLVANTTELEFKTVLEGLCNQTKSFKDECLSIVDQYVDLIYETLLKNLNENEACHAIGICPRNLVDAEMVSKSMSQFFWLASKNTRHFQMLIMPLLPIKTAQRIAVTLTAKPKRVVLGLNEPVLSSKQIEAAQLPIDTLLGSPFPETLVDSGIWCTTCEYLLHFVQETMASPKNEVNIRQHFSSFGKK